eukprot:scaffold4166_cov172-Amphora_coffeaeformis.AAC.1
MTTPRYFKLPRLSPTSRDATASVLTFNAVRSHTTFDSDALMLMSSSPIHRGKITPRLVAKADG